MGIDETDGSNEAVTPVCRSCGAPLPVRSRQFGPRQKEYCDRTCQRKAYQLAIASQIQTKAAANGTKKRRETITRRRIDPTTCERDYTEEEVEFLKALDRYKREANRPFPTASEFLQIAISLGWRKCTGAGPLPGAAPAHGTDVSGDVN